MQAVRFIAFALCLSAVVFLLAAGASVPISLGFERTTLTGSLLLTLSAAVCFVAVPLGILHLFKKRPRDYGWRLPVHSRETRRLFLLLLAFHGAVAVWIAQDPSVQSFYSVASIPFLQVFLFALPLSLIYFSAEEFLFRGFFFFALAQRSLGGAIAVNALLFAVLHISKPTIEIGLAALSAILLSWLSYKTESFLPAALIHFLLALLTLILVNTVYALPGIEGGLSF